MTLNYDNDDDNDDGFVATTKFIMMIFNSHLREFALLSQYNMGHIRPSFSYLQFRLVIFSGNFENSVMRCLFVCKVGGDKLIGEMYHLASMSSLFFPALD